MVKPRGRKKSSAGMGKRKVDERVSGHSPTLATIRMVQDTLKDMPGSVMKISELKRALPRKVNHNTLMVVIDYLEECNRIAVGWRGVCWIHNDSPKIRKVIEDARKKGNVF